MLGELTDGKQISCVLGLLQSGLAVPEPPHQRCVGPSVAGLGLLLRHVGSVVPWDRCRGRVEFFLWPRRLR